MVLTSIHEDWVSSIKHVHDLEGKELVFTYRRPQEEQNEKENSPTKKRRLIVLPARL